MTKEMSTDHKKSEEALQESEKKYRQLFETMSSGVIYQDRNGRITSANPAAQALVGLTFEQMTGKTSMDPRWKMITEDGESLPGSEHPAMIALRTGEKVGPVIRGIYIPEKDEHVWLSITAIPLFQPGESKPFEVYAVFDDITESKKAERHVALLAQIADMMPGAIAVTDYEGRIFYANQRAAEMHGYSVEELMSLNVKELNLPENIELISGRIKELEEKGEISYETWHKRKNGTVFPGYFHAKKIEWDGNPAVLAISMDITEKKKAEEEQKKLQAQLTQAQKMESIGRLAGGVAHDFNNMLGVIMGHAELAIEFLSPGDPLHDDLDQVMKAARRSADLTQQLLAFARKQTISPRVLDLNESINSMLRMLGRLIGEYIELIWKPSENIWPVKADRSQIDQILVNLCVNARDAIVDGGRVTIETDNVVFDDIYCAGHEGFKPGNYVLMSVSDNGCGMDEEIFSHLFEPFFTTKVVGKGTGLGLATVYGAVKQNNGFINVYSEPGMGTTVKIYLPRYEAKGLHQSETQIPQEKVQGSENILLVEDEPEILRLAQRMLERLGYKVLAAATPGEAFQIAREHSGQIDLLMTDVVMPEMNGRDLARNLLSIYPEIRRLFMSGYTADVIAHHGMLDEGVHFIQKPFSMKDLAAGVRKALE